MDINHSLKLCTDFNKTCESSIREPGFNCSHKSRAYDYTIIRDADNARVCHT